MAGLPGWTTRRCLARITPATPTSATTAERLTGEGTGGGPEGGSQGRQHAGDLIDCLLEGGDALLELIESVLLFVLPARNGRVGWQCR